MNHRCNPFCCPVTPSPYDDEAREIMSELSEQLDTLNDMPTDDLYEALKGGGGEVAGIAIGVLQGMSELMQAVTRHPPPDEEAAERFEGGFRELLLKLSFLGETIIEGMKKKASTWSIESYRKKTVGTITPEDMEKGVYTATTPPNTDKN